MPFLSVDEDGRSVLNKPLLRETKEDDKPAGVDQPPKPNEDFPDCTTYFYHRWMWIQVNWRAATVSALQQYRARARTLLPMELARISDDASGVDVTLKRIPPSIDAMRGATSRVSAEKPAENQGKKRKCSIQEVID